MLFLAIEKVLICIDMVYRFMRYQIEYRKPHNNTKRVICLAIQVQLLVTSTRHKLKKNLSHAVANEVSNKALCQRFKPCQGFYFSF